MEYDPTKIRLVLNRADTRVGISQHDVVTVLGREPDIFIPSDREIPRAVNEGVPITLSGRSPYAAASFHELAALFTGGEANGELVGASAAESERPADPCSASGGSSNHGAPRASRHDQAGGGASHARSRSPTSRTRSTCS